MPTSGGAAQPRALRVERRGIASHLNDAGLAIPRRSSLTLTGRVAAGAGRLFIRVIRVIRG